MSIDNISIGPCFIKYKGTDLGFTKGGVEVEIRETQTPVALAQDGENPREIYVTGKVAIISVPMAETNAEKLSEVSNNASFSSGATTLSGGLGTEILQHAGELVAGFVEPDGALTGASVFPKAIPTGEVSYATDIIRSECSWSSLWRILMAAMN